MISAIWRLEDLFGGRARACARRSVISKRVYLADLDNRFQFGLFSCMWRWNAASGRKATRQASGLSKSRNFLYVETLKMFVCGTSKWTNSTISSNCE